MDSCVFCAIAAGQIPSDRVYEDDQVIAFKDLNPVAPVHVLIVPRRHIQSMEQFAASDTHGTLTVKFYPQVMDMELVDYKVRILEENTGTSAVTRVVITTRDACGSWGTIGVSENIIEASWNALADSIEYGLMRIGE